MLLTTGTNSINLNEIKGVKNVYAFCNCDNNNKLSIHLVCDEGNEQEVFENLPQWIHQKLTVVKSDRHVFIKVKQS